MNSQHLTGALIGICALLCLPANGVLAQEATQNCSITAKNAVKACRADVTEEVFLGLGNCQNLLTHFERNICREGVDEQESEDQVECSAQRDARLDACDILGQDRYDPDFDPANFVDPTTIGDTTAANPYLSLVAGTTTLIQTGEEGEETVVEFVTDEIRVVDGVQCLIVKAVEFEVVDEGQGVEYELLEDTDDYYAQHLNGDVWYCGEKSRNYEDGELVDLEGSFEAGIDGAKAGIIMLANPQVGDAYREEWFLDEAEDVGEVTSTAASPAEENEGFECNGACLQINETNALEPDAIEDKFFLADTGFVLAVDLESGEREEVQCVGAALEDCVTDPLLLEALCDASDFFCTEE